MENVLRRKSVRCGLLLVVISIAALIFYWPQPIVRNPSAETAMLISYYSKDGKRQILEDYDEQAVRDYLANCKMRRSLIPMSNSGQFKVDCPLQIMLTGEHAYSLSVGKLNEVAAYGVFRCKIINVDKVLADLCEILGISDTMITQ